MAEHASPLNSGGSSVGTFKMNEGDWLCTETACGNVNFARRNTCNRCGKERVEKSSSKKKLGTEIGKSAADKSRGLFSADDWQCSKCANVNWARRQTCNVCNAPKFGEVEARTGYGGGYNERGTVEYRPRHDSDDDEYDEFGRRKKRKGRDQREQPIPDKVRTVSDSSRTLRRLRPSVMENQVSSTNEHKYRFRGPTRSQDFQVTYTLREKISAAAWALVHHDCKISARLFQHAFDKPAPDFYTIFAWRQRLIATGCLVDSHVPSESYRRGRRHHRYHFPGDPPSSESDDNYIAFKRKRRVGSKSTENNAVLTICDTDDERYKRVFNLGYERSELSESDFKRDPLSKDKEPRSVVRRSCSSKRNHKEDKLSDSCLSDEVRSVTPDLTAIRVGLAHQAPLPLSASPQTQFTEDIYFEDDIPKVKKPIESVPAPAFIVPPLPKNLKPTAPIPDPKSLFEDIMSESERYSSDEPTEKDFADANYTEHTTNKNNGNMSTHTYTKEVNLFKFTTTAGQQNCYNLYEAAGLQHTDGTETYKPSKPTTVQTHTNDRNMYRTTDTPASDSQHHSETQGRTIEGTPNLYNTVGTPPTVPRKDDTHFHTAPKVPCDLPLPMFASAKPKVNILSVETCQANGTTADSFWKNMNSTRMKIFQRISQSDDKSDNEGVLEYIPTKIDPAMAKRNHLMFTDESLGERSQDVWPESIVAANKSISPSKIIDEIETSTPNFEVSRYEDYLPDEDDLYRDASVDDLSERGCKTPNKMSNITSTSSQVVTQLETHMDPAGINSRETTPASITTSLCNFNFAGINAADLVLALQNIQNMGKPHSNVQEELAVQSVEIIEVSSPERVADIDEVQATSPHITIPFFDDMFEPGSPPKEKIDENNAVNSTLEIPDQTLEDVLECPQFTKAGVIGGFKSFAIPKPVMLNRLRSLTQQKTPVNGEKTADETVRKKRNKKWRSNEVTLQDSPTVEEEEESGDEGDLSKYDLWGSDEEKETVDKAPAPTEPPAPDKEPHKSPVRSQDDPRRRRSSDSGSSSRRSSSSSSSSSSSPARVPPNRYDDFNLNSEHSRANSRSSSVRARSPGHERSRPRRATSPRHSGRSRNRDRPRDHDRRDRKDPRRRHDPRHGRAR